MKIRLFYLCLFIGVAAANSQIVNIPDTNFKDALLNHDPIIDTNNDGEIQVTEAESFTESIMVIEQGITDMTGIEAFVNITGLFCGSNNIGSINISSNTTLQTFSCITCGLTTLDLSTNTQLINVIVIDNDITSLDVSNNQLLEELSCFLNPITSLDLTHNAALKHLACRDTNLTSLNLSNNTNLITAYVSRNAFTSLDFSNNTSLLEIDVKQSPNLESLNIANGINQQIITFRAADNPQLDCIQVDSDIVNDVPVFWEYDSGVIFSDDCENLGAVENTLSAIHIYPNPATDRIYIESPQLENVNTISILTLEGKKILQTESVSELNVSQLPVGIYILQINTDNKEIIKKFIKQ